MSKNQPDMKNKELSEMGRRAKTQLGKQTDEAVLDFLQKNPGTTLYEISKGLDWSVGKVQGAISRLEKENKIVLERIFKDGRIANLVYLADHKVPPTGVIKIDKAFLNDSEDWSKQVIVYALNRTTIVITPYFQHGLEQESFEKSTITPQLRERDIILNLPTKFVNFYQLQNTSIDISSDGKAVFVNVNALKSLISDSDKDDALPTNYTILIMDDDKKYARILRSRLYKYFSKIDLAFTEEMAIEKFEKNKPDYLVLDWDILNVRGAEKMMKWMKKHDHNIPAAIITSQEYDEEDERRFSKEGFDVFYDKDTFQFPKTLSKKILLTLETRKKETN